MGQPKLSADVLKLSSRYPAGVLENPTPIAQRFAHTADSSQSAPREAEPPSASQPEAPRAAARDATVSAEVGLAGRTRWLIGGLILAAFAPSLVLAALWLGLIGTSRSTPSVSHSEPQVVTPSAVLTAPDRIEAIAGEDVSFPIALDGTDGVPSRSVIVIRGLPQGSNFSEGRPYGDSEWTLKPDQIGDLDLALPASANGEFKLGIALIAPDDSAIAETETRLEIAPAPLPPDPPVTEASSVPGPVAGEVAITAAVPTGGEEVAAAVPDAESSDIAAPDGTPATVEAMTTATGNAPSENAERAAPPTAPAVKAQPNTLGQAETDDTGLGTVQPAVFVNMREAPSSSSAVLGVIAKGAKLAVLDRKRGWVQVTDPVTDEKGWIYSGNLAGEAKTHYRRMRVAPADAEPSSEAKSESLWGRVGRWLTPD